MPESRELFRALELAHYAERFRDRVFVIALPGGVSFADLLLDFKVLAGYHIQVVLVTEDPGFELEGIIAVANKRGSRFQLSLLTDLLAEPVADGDPALDFQRIRAQLARGMMPVVAYHRTPDGPSMPLGGDDPTYALAARAAIRLEAQKLFLLHPQAGRLRAVLPRSHVVAAELPQLPQRLETTGVMELVPLLPRVREWLEQGIPDVVLVEASPGQLFEEVFTHDGAGILFNTARAARIRPAELRDVTDIALLLRPEVEAERIRPVSEGQIESNLRYYQVYEIDGLLVGLAALKPYGDDAELSQFSTLPRYRGKGRARELALHLIADAIRMGFRRVFALSVDERMWEFFLGLGFEPVARELLPEEWRRGYDMNRPSRAFRKEL